MAHTSDQPISARNWGLVKSLKLASMLAVCVAMAFLVLQNRALIEVRFLWWTGTVSAIVLLFLTAVGGFVLGLLTALLVRGAKAE